MISFCTCTTFTQLSLCTCRHTQIIKRDTMAYNHCAPCFFEEYAIYPPIYRAIDSCLYLQDLLQDQASLTRQLNTIRQRRRRLERYSATLNYRVSTLVEKSRHSIGNKLVDPRSTTDVLLLADNHNNNSIVAVRPFRNNRQLHSNFYNQNVHDDIVQQLDIIIQTLLNTFSRLIIETVHRSNTSGDTAVVSSNSTQLKDSRSTSRRWQANVTGKYRTVVSGEV